MLNTAKPFVVGAGENRSGSKLGGLGGNMISVKVSGADTGNQYAVLEVPTTPDLGPPLHIHQIEDEWFYVLESEHEFQVGSDRVRVASGGSIFAPRLIPHTFRNVSARPGKMLCVAQPAGRIEAFFEELSVLFASNPANAGGMKAIFEKYDMQIVGPPLAGRPRS
jgi:mannose-6-phosphate isomerase-like protein (cupin superfamily)